MSDQPAVSDVRLTAADAAELADLLGFLRDWLTTSEDSETLAASLERFPASAGTDTLPALQITLSRFVSVLTPRRRGGLLTRLAARGCNPFPVAG